MPVRTLAHGERPPTTPPGAGPAPPFFGYQDTHGVAFLGEQAAAPPPPMDRAAAVRGAAILGRPILNRALCRPAKGRRKAQRRRGGARSRGPLCLPRCKYGPRGGEALRRTSFLFPLYVTAVRLLRMRHFRTRSKKRPPQGPHHGDHISPFSA